LFFAERSEKPLPNKLVILSAAKDPLLSLLLLVLLHSLWLSGGTILSR
jgi:hypothetical protein